MIGIAVHPSPTARDGKQIIKSRYIKKSDKRENIIECAQCGFVNDLDAVTTGDSMGSVTSFTAVSKTVSLPVPANKKAITFTDQYADPNRTTGCPFCGSMNQRGVNQNKSWGTSKDISNL